VLEGDIRSCFDNISHEWLVAHVPMDKKHPPQMAKCGLHGEVSLPCD
jgi:RNA-directed DNA polymerase